MSRYEELCKRLKKMRHFTSEELYKTILDCGYSLSSGSYLVWRLKKEGLIELVETYGKTKVYRWVRR